MTNMKTVEAKAFVPARDFALSKRFYQDLGIRSRLVLRRLGIPSARKLELPVAEFL